MTTGASALATPIFGAEKQIVAALTVRGPEVRMSVAKMKQMVPWLIKTSDEISAELGCTGLDRARTA